VKEFFEIKNLFRHETWRMEDAGYPLMGKYSIDSQKKKIKTRHLRTSYFSFVVKRTQCVNSF
jgi:hypothetical protein